MRLTNISIVLCSVLGTALAAGCATDPGDTSADETSSTEQALSSNEKAAFDYFVARGLTKKQSAGIVGNLIQESSVNPKAIEFGGGPGRGIAQWSVGGRWNHSHHDNVEWYGAQHSESRWALHTQLAFTWYELHNVGGYGITALRHTTTITSATTTFERDFEKCGTCDQSKRIKYAIEVYNAFAGAKKKIADQVDDVEVADATIAQGVTEEAAMTDGTPDAVIDEDPAIEQDLREMVEAEDAPDAN